MPADSRQYSHPASNYPAPFDRANFLLPAEWQTLSDLLGANDTGLLFIKDGVIAHANAGLCERLDTEVDDLLGKPVESLFPSGKEGAMTLEPVRGDRIRLLDSHGTPVTFDLLESRVDTSSAAQVTIWVLQPAGHRLAPEKYTAEGTQAQAILDYLPDLVCVCDSDTTLNYASRSLATELGYDGELQGLRLIDLAHPDDRGRLKAAIEPLKHADIGTLSAPFVVRVRHRDGSWRHIHAQARNLASHHAVAGILINGQDVTEQQQHQQNIAAEKKRQLHYLNRLFRMAQRPHANLNPALNVILKSTARALGIHRCAYWEITEDPAASRCVLAYDDIRQNFSEPELHPTFARHFHPLLYRVLHGEQAMAAGDVDQDPRTALHCEYFHAEEIKAAMIVPVPDGDGAIGLLTLFHLREARNWRRDESEFVDNVARLISMIMHEVQRSRSEAQLRHQAHHDSLTGLPNRQFLFEQAPDLLPQLTAGADTMAAFFIDLDGFKTVNDSLGHSVGDELLKAAALRLKNVVRKDDILVRLGGDEFMLLARNLSDMRIADDIAQQVVETMRNTFCLKGRELQISASVGIAMYPQDGSDIETLMKKADLAMYQAKSAGRDQYQMFSARLDEASTDRHTLEHELRRAIEERELRHYYQPQIDIRTGKVRCVEALLRWHHPEQGVLPPARFLPLAEETGLINTISAWALDDICQQLRTWEKAGMDGFRIAVNLSASQLMDRALLPALEQALERTGIPGQKLEWEIKESTAMQHNTMASSLLDRVAELEVGLSIDDFGTGYSNMAYLRKYPVRKVKIDGSLVGGLPDGRDHRAITDAIISMARPLGLDVVAEGVETPEQLEYLREHGCDIAQGFYFSQPLTADQFEKWLIRH
ncbi:MAG TPA: EAL domain-containing protein [Noviherbaspirillum sp.]|nr:EAL domain-containing protein [Noviherbaspirillum sp.]